VDDGFGVRRRVAAFSRRDMSRKPGGDPARGGAAFFQNDLPVPET